MLSHQPCRRLNVSDAAHASLELELELEHMIIDQPRVARVSMVVMCLSKDRTPPGATRSRMIKLTVRIASAATEPPCACICGRVLRAFQPVLLPLKHLAHRLSSYSKHCDEEVACGQCLSGFLAL